MSEEKIAPSIETAERVVEMLEELADAEAEKAVLMMECDEDKAEVLTDEIKAKLEAIQDEYNAQTIDIVHRIESLRDKIKREVVDIGITIRGDRYMAVWNKPRATVNITKLIGYAAAHPEVEALINYGEPSVTIRKA